MAQKTGTKIERIRVSLLLFTAVMAGIVLRGPVQPSGADSTADTIIAPVRAARHDNAAALMPPPSNVNLMDFTQGLRLFSKAAPAAASDNISARNAALYKTIFDLQAKGEMKAANAAIRALSDRRLMGHVLLQRYTHPSAYTSSFAELRDWMVQYADHPGADRIYRLALARKPDGFKGSIKRPQTAAAIRAGHDPLMVTEAASGSDAKLPVAARNARARINDMIDRGRNDAALETLQKNANLFPRASYDRIRARIASGYLYSGKVDHAYKLAAGSAARSGAAAPLAGWVAGLAAWKYERPREAARYFESSATSKESSAWMKSAAAFWAARAWRAEGNRYNTNTWLNRAAENPRTFYGIIAARMLGRDIDLNWSAPNFTRARYDILAATPAGARAIALVAADQLALAESELSRIETRGDDELRNAVIAYAHYAGMAGLTMKFGNLMSGDDGAFYDAALYPDNPWEPSTGFSVDRALINAIARQESKFDPKAESPAGALGLMQLMPATARGLSKNLGTTDSERARSLKDPETNLALGQRYIEALLRDRNVGGDLLKLMVAYNAGPGNLAKWRKQWKNIDDPLLFIELIPSSETRAYVERVLSNYWIYRLREELPTPTLDAVAEGRPALYEHDYAARSGFTIALR